MHRVSLKLELLSAAQRAISIGLGVELRIFLAGASGVSGLAAFEKLQRESVRMTTLLSRRVEDD